MHEFLHRLDLSRFESAVESSDGNIERPSQASGGSAAQARRRHCGLQYCGLGRRDGDDRLGVLQLQARESLAGSCNAPCSGCGADLDRDGGVERD